ncbi:MAG: C-terminal binding protein [Tissierellia bacterium]|nr:C-terminal binding protein [Tissierellia bacterium]
MKVIITDCDHEDINIETEILNSAGMEFELLQCKTEEELIKQCWNAEILINQYAPITESVMKSLPKLKLVIRYGVGVNNIDVVAATKLGVQVCNVPDYGMNEVADHAIALMLSLTRKIVLMNDYTKNTKWDYSRSIPIHRSSTMTVGVVGLGRIGRNFAKKAYALDFNVIGYDPYYKPNEEDGTDYITSVDIETLMKQSDVISIHCPLEGARNLFDENAFKKMKKTAFIINVARGGIINEAALDKALENREIAGAALDCVEFEPMNPRSPLFRHDNFICTPHMAWYSEEASLELKRKVTEEAVRFYRGQQVKYPVNKLS